MPTKAQAKAAVDSAAAAIKADIDGLPSVANITDGKLDFNPNRGLIKMLAPDKATAEGWTSTISLYLGTMQRPVSIRREGNYVDNVSENVITMTTATMMFVINFP
jgi:hypothetical protein